MDLSAFCVSSTIEEVFYIPEFVNEEEEEYLQRKVRKNLADEYVKWKVLPNRRLQVWGGELTPSNALIPQDLPPFVTNYPDIISRLRNTGVFSSSKHGQPNHVIVNEYLPGQGIMPHEDGPTYYPVVATLSLGSHAVFNYHRYLQEVDSSESPSSALSKGQAIDPTPVLSLLLEPRSLVITAKALYKHHLHAIEPLERDVLAPCDPDDTNRHSNQALGNGIEVANWRLLKHERESQAAHEGGVLERGTRLSLTCRDVERIVGGKALGKAFTKR